jgi:hypothetical protein
MRRLSGSGSGSHRRAAALGALLLCTSCGGAMQGSQPPRPDLPAYTARDAQLFDDSIEPEALGYELGQGSRALDPLMADRTGASDGVVRARVITVTSKAEDSGKSLQVALHALETLAGRRAPTGDFTLIVSPRSPSAGMLGAMEGRLVGLTFVVFVKGFAAADKGEPDGELHFHLARDDKDEQNRVRAASLGPLR